MDFRKQTKQQQPRKPPKKKKKGGGNPQNHKQKIKVEKKGGIFRDSRKGMHEIQMWSRRGDEHVLP